jgi:DNA-binding MurR/RpiR family transcriptional regulator
VRQRGDLSERQRKALDALLATPTITAAAERAGVGRATLYRYMGDADFAAVYREERAALVDQAVAGLQKLSIGAVSVLERNFQAENRHVQLRAARTALEFMFKATELYDIEERLRALESKDDDEQSC